MHLLLSNMFGDLKVHESALRKTMINHSINMMENIVSHGSLVDFQITSIMKWKQRVHGGSNGSNGATLVWVTIRIQWWCIILRRVTIWPGINKLSSPSLAVMSNNNNINNYDNNKYRALFIAMTGRQSRREKHLKVDIFSQFWWGYVSVHGLQ